MRDHGAAELPDLHEGVLTSHSSGTLLEAALLHPAPAAPLACPLELPSPLLTQVQRNCVVLPCLHFLYCDVCFQKHCTTSPSCPACNCAITGYHALRLHR